MRSRQKKTFSKIYQLFLGLSRQKRSLSSLRESGTSRKSESNILSAVISSAWTEQSPVQSLIKMPCKQILIYQNWI